LDTDYIDSLIIHNPPSTYLDGNNNPHYEILEHLIDEGKIKAYGASLDSSAEMKLFMTTTNCGVIEPFYNILHQETAAVFDLAKEKNVSLIVKSPLDSGWLSGKYNAESTFKDARKRWSKRDIQKRTKLLFRIREILKMEENLSQTAISFCLAHDSVATVIPGNRTISQLESNAESSRSIISKEHVELLKDFYLNEIKDLNLPY